MKHNKHHKHGKRSFHHLMNGSSLLLSFSLLLFLETFLLNYDKASDAAYRLYYLARGMFIPVVIVFILMVLVNLFVRTSKLIKYMGENSGIKGWLTAIVAGSLSVGNIHFWFPMLKEMKDKGVRPGLIASFLYNRGIKLVWLPIMGLVFGIKYVVILTGITILVSILHGVIVELFMNKNKLPETNS